MSNNFWKNVEETSPYNLYKNKVSYDYEIKIKMPIDTLKEDNTKAEYDDFERSTEKDYYFESQVVDLLKDEDYIHGIYDKLGIGRVYGILDNDLDTHLELTLGISLIQANDNITEEYLKEASKDLLQGILDNIDSMGLYNNESEEYDDYIRIEGNPEQAEIIIKKLKNESINLNEIDKLLVTEGSLVLKKENNLCKFILNDDGKIEKYLNEKLDKSFNFSKTALIEEFKSYTEQGYNIDNNFDIDEAEQTLNNSIEKVDQLQDLKDELNNKVDKLINEDKAQLDNTQFPTSEFSCKTLNTADILNLDLENNLNKEQQNWIIEHIGSLDELKESFIFLASLINTQTNLMSLDEYITYLMKNL